MELRYILRDNQKVLQMLVRADKGYEWLDVPTEIEM